MSAPRDKLTDTDQDNAPFWRRVPLEKMTDEQWESLCDGCARCCLIKLEDIDTGELAFTNISCRLLDAKTCRCTDYANRSKRVPDCIPIKPKEISKLKWMPPTCAYRLLSEGRDLFWWHPLVSGDPDTVHQASISVAGRHICETSVPKSELEQHVVAWPRQETGGLDPK
ncbi:MAG: YcgN family cysteine cluster protein [Alphaproteobacteria bacterium]